MVLPVKPVMAANEVDLQGVDHGPDHEDLSLVGIEAAFETMHADRQRVLCHLLAIDFGADVALEEVEAAIITLNGQFLSGTTSLSAAARSEFGDDCLDLPSLPSSEADVRIVGAYEHGQPIGTTMPRDKPSTETLRSFSFAPPLPPNHQQRTHLSAFATRSAAMQTSLRSIAAKLHLTSSDLSSSSITEQERIIAMHDSIRGDLETLMREWDQSRVSLRSAFAPSSKKKKPAPPMRRDTITQASPRSALELTDDEEEEEEEEGASSELFTPDEDAGDNSILEQDEVEEEAGERVFEAIGGTMERSKLSREERIALARLKREASPVPMGSRDGMIVDELKGVLRELKERRPRVV